MLKMQNISVRNILINLNLTVRKNEFVLIVGENGAGKTTLFNTIAGMIKPGRGSVLIDDQDVTDSPLHIRAAAVANVFQDPKVGTIGSMSIRENLNMAYMRGKKRSFFSMGSSRERDCIYKEKLMPLNMNLENRLDDFAEDLSGGQRQALSIVMSLIADSKILLLDEITAALDSKTADSIIEIINKNVRKQKKTCLMITHNAKHIGHLGDRTLILRDGRAIDLGKR
ncbi:MAG: ATP-binding cassette domain-containing protein [Holosporaceae bacterium]|jgi:putative ABC transport system ATP-binding protein|nr:ATP-binding cassette domain-containing protein [Holosporaceae bacterium]